MVKCIRFAFCSATCASFPNCGPPELTSAEGRTSRLEGKRKGGMGKKKGVKLENKRGRRLQKKKIKINKRESVERLKKEVHKGKGP